MVETSYCIENNELIISSGKAGIQVKKEELKNKIITEIQKQVKCRGNRNTNRRKTTTKNRYRKNKARNI